MDMDEFDRTLAINLRGIILCMKYAIPLLKRQGGSIINMSSQLGLRAQPLRTPYCASKSAIIAITQSVAYELGETGVRANVVCPAAVKTALNMRLIATRSRVEGISEEELIRTKYVGGSAMKRWVVPEDIADAALFLASEACQVHHRASISGWIAAVPARPSNRLVRLSQETGFRRTSGNLDCRVTPGNDMEG